MKRTITLLTLIFFIHCISFAQPVTSSSDGLYIQPGYQLASLIKNPASFVDIEIGKEISNYSIGAAVHILASKEKHTTSAGNERVSSLWYLGPRFTYHVINNNSFTYYLGSSVGIGSTDYSKLQGNTSTEGGLLYGIEPETGIRLQLNDHIALDVKTTIFFGKISDGKSLTSAPSIRAGIRFIK